MFTLSFFLPLVFKLFYLKVAAKLTKVNGNAKVIITYCKKPALFTFTSCCNTYICALSMKIFNYIIFLTASILITSCLDDPDCNSKTTNFVNVKFYNSSNNEADTLNVSSLAVIGIDSILVEEAKVSYVRLPLRPDTLETTFIFDTELGIDTLILKYNINTRLISEDCGIERVYADLDVVRSDFESFQIVNKVLVKEITEDVKIFN